MAMRVSLTLRVLAVCAIILSYQAELGRPQLFGGGECDTDACLVDYTALQNQPGPWDSVEACPIIDSAIECLSEGDCAEDFMAIFLRENIINDQQEYCEVCDIDACLETYALIELQLGALGQELVCPIIEEALNCLDRDVCASSTAALLTRENVQDSYYDQNCSTPTTTPTLTPTTPTLLACPPPDSIPDTLSCNSLPEDCCPRLPNTTCDPVRSVEPASVLSLPSGILQHCSVFSYSHVRPWGAYGPRIDTCSLPGSWFLVKHSNFSIEVEASADSANSPYTKLDKVNLTFYDPIRTYVADASMPLPVTFNEGYDQSFSSYAVTDTDRTVATIFSTSLSVTVIIRRYANHLSVTVQVPGRMILETQGLCDGGCPHHAYRNITEFINNFANPVTSECSPDYNTTTFDCFTYIGNGRTFGISNSTYTQVCQFDVLLERNLKMVTVINATVQDALMLPDVGSPPPPFTEEPTLVTVNPDDFTTPSPDPTSDAGLGTGTFSSALPLASLHIMPLLLTLLSTFLAQR